MTANSGPPSEPPKGHGFKVTLAQGIIGAISLAGTTAIPLVVNRYLSPPAESPAPAAQVSPVPATIQASPLVSPGQTGSVTQLQAEPVENRKGKKKKQD